MNHQLDQTQVKKTYEPPQLTTVSLRPEEAVLGHCKILGQSSQPGGICGITCFNSGS
jgi:hypothetical protein